MINIQNKGIILEKTEESFENQAVLNPGCIKIGDTVHMLYRAVKEGNFSTIGYCKIKDFAVIERFPEPVLFPENDYEKQGVEDPRIVEIDGLYYIFYTAYDGKNALVAYATTKDFKNFEKHGVISPDMSYETALEIFRKNKFPLVYLEFGKRYQRFHGKTVKLWDKDMFLFPKKINGKFTLVHRIMPGIQILSVDSLSELNEKFWLRYLQNLPDYSLLEHKFWYETWKIGGGCPPIETNEGWIFIYHGVEQGDSGHIYHASAALLDKDDPSKVIGRLRDPLFSPSEIWEKEGDVNNVVFPTAAYLEGDDLVVFYGAADKRIAAKIISVKDLLAALKKDTVA